MKITLEHLKIYKHYGGDGDALIRLGSEREKRIMTYEAWRCIEEMLQEISISSTNLNQKLSSKTETQEVIDKLKEIALND